MGAFYGSIHVRSDGEEALRSLLEGLAATGRTRFLMAAPRNGWTTIYPSDHGQDFTVSAALASQVACPVLHLMLHDDDVFAYALYDAGGPIDEYCSDPDYFEVGPQARWTETAGRPDLLAALNGGDAAQIARILERGSDDPFAAGSQMRALAKALGITGVETSYEDLRSGEGRRVSGLVHVPDLASEKEAAKRRRAEVAARTKRLREQGVLLVTRAGKAGSHARPLFRPHPAGGFLLAWTQSSEPAVEWWRHPWTEPTAVDTPLSPHGRTFCLSPSGRFLARDDRSSGWKVELMDLHEQRVLATIPSTHFADWLAFDSDERRLFLRSGGEVWCGETEAPHAVLKLTPGAGQGAALHPDGRWMVTPVLTGHACSVAVLDLRGEASIRTLGTARHDFAAWRDAVAGGGVVTAFMPQELPRALGFSSNGELLFVVVEQGVRVYRWSDVLAARTDLPAPIAAADTDVVEREHSRSQQTYAFAYDEPRRRVLFSGLDGMVRALDVDTGRSAPLLEVPGGPPVTDLSLSVDYETLATASHPAMIDREARKRPAPIWQAWSLSALPSQT